MTQSMISRSFGALLTAAAALALAACGQSDSSTGVAPSGANTGTASVVVSTSAALHSATPTFHSAPIVLEEPSDVDRADPSASAHLAPHTQPIPAELSGLSTRHLTREVVDGVLASGLIPAENDVNLSRVAAQASTATVTVYTPAQIRAAYNLPALPAANVALTSAQAASLGAGQTIYIVDAGDDPNVVAELSAYNLKFGLPACSSAAVLTHSTPLPLGPQPTTSGCTLLRAYSSPSGSLTSTEPGWINVWNIEIAADVELAHTIAPLARIVLIEASDDSNGLVEAIALANQMGPGVVSMSWGIDEGAFVPAVDGVFNAPNMTYTASAGDAGYEVIWPSSSAHVIGVGGTTLNYSGASAGTAGSRSEVLWSYSGGGVSQYTAAPTYQNNSVLGLIPASGRITPDVSFNADPQTGQYIDYYPGAGSTAPNWLGFGGTSAGAPQWAGLIAIANAERATKPELPLGDAHALLYTAGTNTSIYGADIFDITSGHRGSCIECITGIGFDGPTGLGTPNAGTLLGTLIGNPIGAAPVVTAASVKGISGIALSFQASINSRDPLSVSLIGAPTGASISNTGLFTWANPVQGNYSFTVQAVDTVNNLYGHATYTLTITGAQPPVVPSSAVTVDVGQQLQSSIVATLDSNPLTYSAANAPPGFVITSQGWVAWSNPSVGVYPITITASDAKTGLSGSGTYTITVPAPTAPTCTNSSYTRAAGSSFAVGIGYGARPGAQASNISVAVAGLPSGITFKSAGGAYLDGTASVAPGNYSIPFTVTDNTAPGLSCGGTVSLSVVKPGPVLTTAPITGVAGKAVAAALTVSDPLASTVTLTVTGMPSGLAVASTATGASISWKTPVTGTYTLTVKAVDSSGLSASATVPVTITAH